MCKPQQRRSEPLILKLVFVSKNKKDGIASSTVCARYSLKSSRNRIEKVFVRMVKPSGFKGKQYLPSPSHIVFVLFVRQGDFPHRAPAGRGFVIQVFLLAAGVVTGV